VSVLDDARTTLTNIAQDEKVAPHLRIGAVNRLLQLERLVGKEIPGGDEQADSDAPLLTPTERVTLRDTITWGFDPGLWDRAQRTLVVKLGLWTKAELDAEIETLKPRRVRRR